MKVLHIGKYFSPFRGGLETYMRDLMAGSIRRGVECAALVHNHDHSLRSRDEEVIAGGERLRVTRVGSLLTFFFTPISPSFRGQVKRVIREFEPDVVHVHLPNPSACWLLTVGAVRSIPLVIHWHSDVITTSQGPMMKFLYALYRPFEKKLLARAQAIIATSESYLKSSESLQAWPEKCHVVPLGLDPVRLREEDLEGAEPPVLSPDLQVLAVGRLTYYKGFGYLVRAAAKTRGIKVHIVGRGEQEWELKKLARKLGTGDRITFHGELSGADLAARFHACDCLCLPSIERTEAFGLVLLEAMYFSKATVISDVPGSGMGWVVEDGETGIKTPPRDPQKLAMALERLRDDRSLARRLGEAGRRKFDQVFSIDHSVNAMAEIYRVLIKAERGQAK